MATALERADAALTQLDEALESKAPSTIEALAGLVGGPMGALLLGVLGAGVGVYKGIRAKRGDVAIREFAEGVEEISETEHGKKLTKKLA